MKDKPLLVEVIAYAPTAFYHCAHCEVAWREAGGSNRVREEQLQTSLPQDLLEEYAAVSDWVRALFQAHGERLVVQVIDAASAEGALRSLRYWVRRYPAVVINKEKRFSGKDALAQAGEEIARLLAENPPDLAIAS